MARTWVDVQKKTFTGWANNYLKERILKINNIEHDLEDGVLLINLLEIISGKNFVKYTKNPKGRFQKIENNNWAIKFIQNEGLKLVGIGGEDLVDGKVKLILGLIWTLILRYQIQNIEADDENSPKSALLEWVRKRVAPYDLTVNDFDRSWQDGRVLTALTDSLRPGVLPFNSRSGDPFTDINKAMDIAQDDFNIPKIMDPQDLVSIPDELSVMTYVSYFRDYALEWEKKMEEHLKFEEQRKKTRADPSKCRVEGPGLQGGVAQEAALFTIYAHNYYGEPLASGGENFIVTVTGEDGERAESAVTDKRDGTYNVAYMPQIPQGYTVTVKLEEHDVKDTPIQVKIEGGDAKNSVAYGPGVEGGDAGKPAPFTIQAKDSKGQNMKHGGDPFEVMVTLDGQPVNTEITDLGDGTYSVTYYPDYPGEYNVDVALRGEPISGSTYKVVVFAGTPGHSYAEGPGLEKGQAGHPAHFKIHSVNSEGQKLTQGGDPFAVLVEGPHPGESVEPSVIDNGDGTYDVTYTPSAPGDYKVSVFLFEKPIKDMPKEVHFKPASDPSKTEVKGPGLHGGQAEEDLHFKIIAKDGNGHQRHDGGDQFSVRIDGPVEVSPQVVDNGDGTYDVTYNTSEPGDYVINVLLDNDKPVADLPKNVHIKPAASAANSYAEGEGLHAAFDNEPAKFVIHAVDPKGNPRTDGGDAFQVKIHGPHGEVHPTVHDNNDGTYNVSYEPHAPGNYEVNVTLKDQPIKDCPHRVHVKEGTDADASGFGSFSLTVVSRDKHKQPKTFGGDRFEVSITGPSEHVQVEAKDNGDGTYTASYTLVGSGRYVVDVKLNGRNMDGSPFKQNIGSIKKGKEVQNHTFHARVN